MLITNTIKVVGCITMLVGVITGTYSSVFIAAAIVIIWQGRRPLKGQAVLSVHGAVAIRWHSPR